jgi:hypothetical protein
MKLTKQQLLQLQTALLDGYDRAGLRRMVRLGLDVSLDEITSGTTDSDVVFDVIEWAERGDKVTALIQAAVDYNDQNRAIQQLTQDSSAWFAPVGPTKPTEARPPAEASAAPTANTPQYSAGGDVIVANIGGGSEDIAVGKNIQQSTDETKPRKKK